MFYGLAVVDLKEYVLTEEYDIAICQFVLRHLSNSENILKKMVDSVKENGLVIIRMIPGMLLKYIIADYEGIRLVSLTPYIVGCIL